MKLRGSEGNFRKNLNKLWKMEKFSRNVNITEILIRIAKKFTREKI